MRAAAETMRSLLLHQKAERVRICASKLIAIAATAVTGSACCQTPERCSNVRVQLNVCEL
jgi:hypothetical protein